MKLRVFLFLIFVLPLSGVASASEYWTQVRSKSFTLIGNVDENELRRTGVRLEQFRRTFQELFPNSKFNDLPTNAIVFKNRDDLNSFQPVSANGQPQDVTNGYFQAGEDVNYIALATKDGTALQPIFHDYVHYFLNQNFGRAVIPPWVNEGLAEYYQTFSPADEKHAARLGASEAINLRLLQEQNLIPLERLFALDYYTLRNQGSHGKGIFYAEPWALIHYLQEDNKGARREQLKTFLNLLANGKASAEAFTEAFKTDLATIEKEFKGYLAQRVFPSRTVTLKNASNVNSEMTSNEISEAEAIAYQGDLLLHLNRYEDAAKLLRRAIALDAKNALADAALGVALARQNRFDEAFPMLEKAIALDAKNYLPHYYLAEALSRENLDNENFARPFSDEKTVRMRALLTRVIELNPNFAPAYRLLAFINLANNEDLNAAIISLKKALALEPGNERYALDLGRIYLRQEKFDEARQLGRKVFAAAEDANLRANAQILLGNVASLEEQLRQIRERNARRGAENEPPAVQLSPAELINQSLNEALRKPKAGEKRIVGYLSQISCEGKTVSFTIRTPNQILKLRSDDFLSVRFMAFTAEASGKPIDCGLRKPEDFVVVTFRAAIKAQTNFDGEIVAVEFVPKTFELKQL